MTNMLKGEKSVAEPNPFVAGQSAAKAGHTVEVCPYVKNSHAWVRWLNGWRYQLRVDGKPEPTTKKAAH